MASIIMGAHPLGRRRVVVWAFLAAVLALSFYSSSASAAAASNEKIVAVIGSGECADCAEKNIKNADAFKRLHVKINCKAGNGEYQIRGVGDLDEDGKFSVELPSDLVEDFNGELKEECFAQLHGTDSEKKAALCAVINGPDVSKIVLKKSKDGRRHTFGTAGRLAFSSDTCASAFGCKHPLHKPFPKFSLPPYHFPPKVFPPIYKKPLPPPTPVYEHPLPPPVPVYKKPLHPPVPVVKKPCPPVPVYKPPPVPVYKKPLPPPVPIYKPPVVVPKLPPIYKKPHPPIPEYPPIYKKPPLPPLHKLPPFPEFPPVYKKPCPPIPHLPPKDFFHHPPKYGFPPSHGWPPMPPKYYKPKHPIFPPSKDELQKP